MKRPDPPSEQTRFSGIRRHYHRSNPQVPRTWDDWVEGARASTKSSREWPKIIGITCGVLAIGGIAIGLIIELG